VAPGQMDRDNVTAMETDKIVDDDIGSPQVNAYTFNSRINIEITLSFCCPVSPFT